MRGWLQKILLIIAVFTILGHGLLPHKHPDHAKAVPHHHHGQGHKHGKHHQHEKKPADHHNIFSYAQLDESFVRAKFLDFTINLPVHDAIVTECIEAPALACLSITHFGTYKEYPPPGCFGSMLPSRGPPPSCRLA
jgi:hypothetical protein